MARYMATASTPKVGLPPSHVPIPTRAQRIATLHWAPRSGADDAELNSSAEEMVQQLLNTDPETLAQMSRVKDAARRVAELQMEQARLARALAEAEENDEASAALRERRAEESSSALLADAEVKAGEDAETDPGLENGAPTFPSATSDEGGVLPADGR